jgi:hypothetical protein
MDGKLILETANGTQFANLSSAAGAIAFDQWQHVAAVIDRSNATATLYCNSQVVASGSVRNDFSNNAILRVGAMAGGGFPLRCTMDDLRLHSRTLSRGKILSLVAASNTPPGIPRTIFPTTDCSPETTTSCAAFSSPLMKTV